MEVSVCMCVCVRRNTRVCFRMLRTVRPNVSDIDLLLWHHLLPQDIPPRWVALYLFKFVIIQLKSWENDSRYVRLISFTLAWLVLTPQTRSNLAKECFWVRIVLALSTTPPPKDSTNGSVRNEGGSISSVTARHRNFVMTSLAKLGASSSRSSARSNKRSNPFPICTEESVEDTWRREVSKQLHVLYPYDRSTWLCHVLRIRNETLDSPIVSTNRRRPTYPRWRNIREVSIRFSF